MSRILFVTERYIPDVGGLAQSGARISAALAKLGHDVHVLAMTGQLNAGEVETARGPDGVTVHQFGRSRKVDFTQQQALIFLEWLHAKLPFDLVWSHYAWQNGFMGVWFAERFNIRSVVSVRGNDLDRQVFPPGDFSRLQWMLERATRIVSVSADLASKIQTLVRRDALVLHNSVDREIYSAGKPDPGLLENYCLKTHELVLVFCGELRAKKGLAVLLECFQQTAKSRPTRLLVIGEVRNQDRGVFERELANIENWQEQIIVTGHLPDQADVASHLRLGDIFLLPSLWDGLPNSLLEAMAIGLPVIASDAGAIGEVLTHNVNGIIVPRSHLHQLAGRVDQFLSRPASERNRIVQAASEYVAEHHSLEKEAAQLQLIVSDVLVA